MPTLLELVATAASERRKSSAALKDAITKAKAVHSWGEIAKAADMSRGGVIHLAQSNGKGE
jgi:hypothetical protein